MSVTEHNHVPDPGLVDVKRVLHRIRERAASSNDIPRRIIQETGVNVSTETTALLPKYTSIQRNVQRNRKKEGEPISAPNAVTDIEIPQSLCKTYNGDNFLAYDSGADDPDRFFIFCSPENLKLLKENKHWCADGTFKVAPVLFYQIYVIHITIEGRAYPMLYALLQNKGQQTYRRMLDTILYLDNDIQPETIMCDFEKAFHGAVNEVFPDARLVGCLFHLGQSVWRKIGSLNLTNLYLHDEQIRSFCKMLVALAFVPADDVVAVFEKLQDEIPSDLDDLFNYFEDSYIGRPYRRRRKDPFFRIELWNIYDRIERNLPKTNNAVEGWHRAFQTSLGHNHPTVYKFVEFLRLEQDHTEKKLTRLNVGQQDVTKHAKYERAYTAIKQIVSEYDTRADKLDYLHAISYQIKLQK